MKRNSMVKGISLLLSAALLISGCGQEAETEGTVPAVAVRAVSPKIGTLTVSNQFVGTVTPQQQVSVIPLVSGVIDAVYAEVGDEVSAGQMLFHIEDDAAKLQAESASASKKSAEASAKMQLGSAQVMNNISMESNIRSIEYQIEMAKDQLNTAANGVQDAEDAKGDLKKAEQEINDSIDGLQDSYKEMEGTVAQAKNYIVYDVASQEYRFKTVYDYPKAPDEYNWDEENTDDAHNDNESGAANGGLVQPSAPTETETVTDSSSAEDESGGQTQSSESESSESERSTTEGSATDSGTIDSKPAGNTGGSSTSEGSTEEALGVADDVDKDNVTSDADRESSAVTSGENHAEDADTSKEEREEVPSDGQNTAFIGNAAYEMDSAYFDIELIREAEPVYLAEAERHPKDEFSSLEAAREAYNEQQKIDGLKSKTEKMGYSPSDIKTGKADADMVEYAANIAMLQYQSSQMKSSKSSLDSNIKSGETAESSSKKTIDFYQDNLKDAQTTYGIQNGQAYQDTADALAAQIAAADVGVKSAQLQLEYYSPSTPISGTVVSKGVELYGMAQPGYAAYVISNQAAMNVTFLVSGQVRNSLMEGMSVTLEKDGETFQGTITEIGEAVDAQSGGMFTVKAVTEAGGDKLANGAAVKLTVDTFRADNAVLIPYDAVHFESEKSYVFQIVDGKAVRTAVTIGLMNDDMVEVTEGLAADAKIIATWSSQLEDGAAVRIIGEEGAAE